ncbi:MAG: hypothetical protein SAK29_15570 [Scytonema sp. PMC 1069.18]|nr:hypothetical protein [Scytonema sp. PMC 1069.18]MEC4886369.1 hypothetical protein [Scytonema sp. PMC 1070.18]
MKTDESDYNVSLTLVRVQGQYGSNTARLKIFEVAQTRQKPGILEIPGFLFPQNPSSIEYGSDKPE